MQTERCSTCLKPESLCLCREIQALATQTHVLILQHPQEPNENLGTARLAHLALSNSTLKIGLSWPNLNKALGREVQASKWAVLYLGSGIKKDPTQKDQTPSKANSKPTSTTAAGSLQFISRQGTPAPRPESIEGVVILDGTWSQAKALWWRNAWLLKLKRAVLLPQRKSLYRHLRKEPRPECLSTIESISETLTALGEPATVSQALDKLFQTLLEKYQAGRKKQN